MVSTVNVMKAYAKHFRESRGTETEKLLSMDLVSHRNEEFKAAIRESNALIDNILPNASDLTNQTIVDYESSGKITWL